MLGLLQGSWSHYTSTDLLRWTKGTDTNFTYLTGSVSPTSTGVYAFYPTVTQSSIAIAVAGVEPTRSCTISCVTAGSLHLKGEYRAGGRVDTPSRVAPPVGRQSAAPARQLHLLLMRSRWLFGGGWVSEPQPQLHRRRHRGRPTHTLAHAGCSHRRPRERRRAKPLQRPRTRAAAARRQSGCPRVVRGRGLREAGDQSHCCRRRRSVQPASRRTGKRFVSSSTLLCTSSCTCAVWR